jgi:hypothetical protein
MDLRNRVKSWSKTALVLIGIFALVIALNKATPLPLGLLKFFRNDWSELGAGLLVAFTPFLLTVIAAVLICFPEAIAKRICEQVSGFRAIWEPAAYRLAFVLAGVLVLSWAFFNLAGVGERILQLVFDGMPQGWRPVMWDGLWVSLIHSLLTLSIGGYLVCGASRLLKWQLQRTQTGTSYDVTAPIDLALLLDRKSVGEPTLPGEARVSELVWVRLGLAVLGVIAVGFAAKHLTGCVRLLGKIPGDAWEASNIMDALGLLISPLPLLLAAYLLIRHCDSLARRIADDAKGTAALWERNAYQIAITFAGILIVAYVFPTTVSVLANMILMVRHAPGKIDEAFLPRGNPWFWAVHTVIQTGFGLLLIWVAPWLIKWQTQMVVQDQPT